MIRRPPRSTLFPNTPLFRSVLHDRVREGHLVGRRPAQGTVRDREVRDVPPHRLARRVLDLVRIALGEDVDRSEEHTSELQSLAYLVCRLLLEKKKRQCTTHQ